MLSSSNISVAVQGAYSAPTVVVFGSMKQLTAGGSAGVQENKDIGGVKKKKN